MNLMDPLESLIARWERIVQTVSVEYDGMREEYVNDLMARSNLEGGVLAMGAMETQQRRIAQADELFKASTTPDPAWHENTIHVFWDPNRDWWFSRRPLRPGPHWL
jgi:hypothetical protein